MDLDVGVGSEKCHRARPWCVGVDLQPSRFTDFLEDVQDLPFKDNSFDTVYATHILEHVENPAKALHELIRVAKYQVYIEVPHRFSSNAKGEHGKTGWDKHRSFFRCSWFHRLLDLIDCRYKVEVKYRFPLLLHICVDIALKPVPRDEELLRASLKRPATFQGVA